MAWIQVHQTLKDHRKLFDAADELEISPPHMMGLLISFWLWALDNAPTGKLDGITHRMIARAAQYEGDPDWFEYAGKLIDQRKAEKERSQRRRDAAAAAAGENADDQQTASGQPKKGRRKAAGRVDQSRVDKSTDGTTPPFPSDEGADEGKKDAIEVRFAEFWSAYPKKVAKQYALKAWKRLRPDAELHEKIMQAVNAQKRSEQWRRDNGRYIPNPATWLNGGQWDNELEEVTTDAENRGDPERSSAADADRDYSKGFKSADDLDD